MTTYHFINGRETSEQIHMLRDNLEKAWRALQYKCYDCIWCAFMGQHLNEYEMKPQDPRRLGFPFERIKEFEEFVEINASARKKMFTDRKSYRDVDFTVSYVLEHLLKDHQGERIDGWIYINTQTLIKNIHDNHNSYNWSLDRKHEFVRRANNKGKDFHSEINVFNASRGKFDYEGASEVNPYLVAYKDMKFRSKF